MLRRRDHVQPDQPEVLGHRRHPALVGLVEALVLAEVARADRRGLLGHVHAVCLAEQGEDAVRMVARDRLVFLLRQVAVHDRGLGALGGVEDRVGVLEPGGVARQLREPGIAHLVQPALVVDQGVHGQLVEEHHHDRRLGHAADGARLGLVGEGQLGDRAAEQEQQQEHQRDRREDVEERADQLGSQPQQRQRHADRRREGDQHCVRGVECLLQGLDGEQGHECAQQHAMRDPPGSRAGEAHEQLHRQQQRRRQDHQQHREGDDVEAGGPPGRKELRVVLEQDEERLGHREGPQHRQVQVGQPGLLGKAPLTGLSGFGGAHPRLGVA